MKSYNFKKSSFKIKKLKPSPNIKTEREIEEAKKQIPLMKNQFKHLLQQIEILKKKSNHYFFFIEYRDITPKTKRFNLGNFSSKKDVPQIGSHITNDNTFKIYYKLNDELFIPYVSVTYKRYRKSGPPL